MRQFLTFLENIDKNYVLVNFIKDGYQSIMENYYPDDDDSTLISTHSILRGIPETNHFRSTALDRFNRDSANMASENGLGVLSFLRNSEKSLNSKYSDDMDQELDDTPTNDVGVTGDLTVNIHIAKTYKDDSLGISLAGKHL